MELYNAECIEHMKTMEERSVDLFVLDLPYANKMFGKCTDMGWDTPIDLTEMWIQIKRIMKPSAVIVHFCNVKFGFALIQSNPKWFRYDLIWKKSRKVGFLNASKQPLRQHENIYVFKPNQGVYNPQKTEGKPYVNGADKNPNNVYTFKKEKGTIIKTDRHPTSIIEHNNPSKSIHQTQKPVSLLEWLIKSYSNEGDVVMDFCMGSGTAGIACLNTKRYFIGVEKDEETFNLATKRIEEHEMYC